MSKPPRGMTEEMDDPEHLKSTYSDERNPPRRFGMTPTEKERVGCGGLGIAMSRAHHVISE